MKNTLLKLRNAVSKAFTADEEDYAVPAGQADEEYVELTSGNSNGSEKIKIRPFVLDEFASVKPVLECLREGYTIALVNLQPLKQKDVVELKRAVNKLKKTTEAINGDIAGFGEDWIIVAPSFVEVFRGTRAAVEAAKKESVRDVRMDDDADMFKDEE